MQDINDLPSEADSQKDVIPNRKKNTDESKAAHLVTTPTGRNSRINLF